ncbi:dTDP-4-amino-4,6-dideoxy-D-galactose acyltransferase [Entomohabitans teleogrylli]|uniref:dTDP-4-amino-4,6-dideoxy-D-galactose acyltransferase n=1 Tax=Entomohabitans teleogrylli TaxID=1384589 RepID=UPI00073D739A|nr:dTDP-4-amino-4,6-dideoxy-D-galactose acyltransferase [Entomohabitans teleogrylli]
MRVLASIDPLNWESEFFAIRSGIVRFTANGEPLNEARLAAWPRVQAKIASARSDRLDALQGLGFRLVEGEIDFLLAVGSGNRDAGLQVADAADIPMLREMAARQFSQSRFRAPWYQPQDSGRFYACWVENAVRGTFDHQCLILRNSDASCRGFVTLRQLDGGAARIGLLAGRGAGEALMAAARFWCETRGLTQLFVATQISNRAAIRRYIHSGAVPDSSAYWLYR